MTKPKTIEELKDIVREHEPNMSLKNPHMVTVLVFLTICQVGLDEDKTVEFIGYKGKKEKQIRSILRRMAEVGILTSEDGTKALRVEWFNKDAEKGSIALTMDAMTVTGEFERTISPEGKFQYGLTQNGKRMAENVLKRAGINPAKISREKSK